MSNETLNILRIDGSMRQDGSVTRKLTDDVVAALAAGSTENVVVRDLASGVELIDEEWIGANFTPEDSRTDAQRAILSKSDELVQEMKDADVLVIGVPIYNFSIPAALKAWIDLIARAGVTFRYTENGPIGLLDGKRAIVVLGSGGVPKGAPVDFASTYMQQVLGFVGITDVRFVDATGLGGDAEARMGSAVAEIPEAIAA